MKSVHRGIFLMKAKLDLLLAIKQYWYVQYNQSLYPQMLTLLNMSIALMLLSILVTPSPLVLLLGAIFFLLYLLICELSGAR